jgi:hypothetical protein
MRAYEFLNEEELEEGKLAKFIGGAAIAAGSLLGSPQDAQSQEITASAVSSDMQFAVDKAVMKAKMDYLKSQGQQSGQVKYDILKQDIKPKGGSFEAIVTISVKN